MVVPLVIGALGLLGGTYLLAGVVSHLVQPVSLLAAAAAGLGTFVYLRRGAFLRGVFDSMEAEFAAYGLFGAVAALVAYKAFVWAVAALGLVAGLSVIVVVALGGGAVLQVVLVNIVAAVLE